MLTPSPDSWLRFPAPLRRSVAPLRRLYAWLVAAAVASLNAHLLALATELRETGELTQLLGRAATGHRLDAAERAKVRAQLLDVAKVVPAVALLAAPGGLLLLPLLAKVLPFSVLPSAWDRPRLAAQAALAPATVVEAPPPAGARAPLA